MSWQRRRRERDSDKKGKARAQAGVVVGQRIGSRLVITWTLPGSDFSFLLPGSLSLLFTSFHNGQNHAFLSPITINSNPKKQNVRFAFTDWSWKIKKT